MHIIRFFSFLLPLLGPFSILDFGGLNIKCLKVALLGLNLLVSIAFFYSDIDISLDLESSLLLSLRINVLLIIPSLSTSYLSPITFRYILLSLFAQSYSHSLSFLYTFIFRLL